jgi:hypothetical protein
MHEAGALPVGSSRKGRRGDDGPGVLENIRGYGGKSPALVVETATVLDKYRNIIVGIRAVIAPRPRALQDNALQPVTVNFGKRDAEARQNRVIVRRLVSHAAVIGQLLCVPQIHSVSGSKRHT